MLFKHMEADDRAWLIRVLSVEGEINRIWAEASEGAEPGADIFVAEFEYDLWDDE